jgi:hypothetical protein
MNPLDVLECNLSAKGLLVSYNDGLVFLFPRAFLVDQRNVSGQIVGGDDDQMKRLGRNESEA